jgi:hypothetical protein
MSGCSLSKFRSYPKQSRSSWSKGVDSISAQGSAGPRIHLLDVPASFQPERAPYRYPAYAKDYGVEQDFHLFLKNSYQHKVPSPVDADFLYLPVYWTRFYMTHGVERESIDRVRRLIESFVHLKIPVFTVCQWDDGTSLPQAKLIEYLASRNGTFGLDAPLLASSMPKPFWPYPLGRRYLANFVGRVETHPIRNELQSAVEGNPKVLFDRGPRTPREFSRILSQSLITLCPRGYGGSSFRFWEAIHHGSLPWLIGDIDTRPFKGVIDWDQCSLYSRDVPEFVQRFDALSEQEISDKRGYLQSHVTPLFTWGRWCSLLIEELGANCNQT